MTNASTTPEDIAFEKPLGSAAKLALIACAASAILLFYLFATASIALLLVLLASELFGAVALARIGMTRFVTPFIERHSALLMIFLRSFWLRKGAFFRVPVVESDAPSLFAFLKQLSERMHIAPPEEVVIEMSATAWVRLGGFRRGSKATTLGLGYDLLAGLSAREVEAVLAHEMAHAKLVRRGLKRWLAGGVGRAIKLTNELAGTVDAYRRSLQSFELGEWFLAGAHGCTRLGVRMMATYSRQDEFEADRGATEICGSAPLRSSLIKLEKLTAKTARISWSERVAQLQRQGGFSSWLVDELAGTDAVSESIATSQPSDSFSTHPSLRDRLAALPPDDTQCLPSSPAIRMFANPDAVAAKLVAEIQRVAAIEEQRDSRERQRWLRRIQRGGRIRGPQWVGILVLLVGLFSVILAWADGFRIGILIFALGTAASGVGIYRFGRYRDRRHLPVPDFAMIKAAWERPDDFEARRAREAELYASLQSRVGGTSSKKDKRELLISEGYGALAQCDYLLAHVAARQCLDVDKDCVEGTISLAIASAALRHDQHAHTILGVVNRLTGLASPSMIWGAGWTLVLMGDWTAAEALLEKAFRTSPDEPTFAALLAFCQAHRNKVESARINARFALAAAPRDKERTKLLLNLLLNGGYLQEARQLMAGADTAVRADAELTMSTIRLFLLSRDIANAKMWTEELRQHGIAAHHAIQLGVNYEVARLDEQAVEFYELALQHGYYPEAHLGLARLAAHRGENSISKTHVLAGLNTTRTVGEKGQNVLSLFTAALGQLLQLNEPITNAEAWVATVTGNAVAGPLSNQAFLVFAANMHDAHDLFRIVVDAVQPDKPSLMPALVRWDFAPKDQQPVGHVRPGIQRFWRS